MQGRGSSSIITMHASSCEPEKRLCGQRDCKGGRVSGASQAPVSLYQGLEKGCCWQAQLHMDMGFSGAPPAPALPVDAVPANPSSKLLLTAPQGLSYLFCCNGVALGCPITSPG